MKFNYLRLVALFLMMIGAGAFTSCSSLSDGGEGTGTDSAYVGDWRLVKATFTGEVPDASEFAGFSIALNSEGTYVLTNPTNFPSPTAQAGVYVIEGAFLIFDGATEVAVTGVSGNSMTWEWQVARPGKITATYRYTFERM